MADQHGRADVKAKESLSNLDTGFHFQHIVGLLGQVWCALYAGRPEEAASCLQRYWPDLQASRMLDLQLVRFIALRLRAQTAIARAAEGAAERDKLLAQAADGARLAADGREHVVAMSELARAGIARVKG